MHIVRLAITMLIALAATTLLGQGGAWKSLSMVTNTKEFDINMGFEVTRTKVSPMVQMLEGKEMEVKGYFIPLTGKSEQNHFMLSKFPQDMCFFCGKAGPETAMQVFLANGKKQAYSDEKITIKGILRINTTDAYGLLYTLEDAQVIKS